MNNKNNNIVKLHLGCGEKYLDGYINIDFPKDKHTVQTKVVADKLTNILLLKYRRNSIDEIRLHHLFEHFPRTVAYSLLASWGSWLKKGGLLRIEVPDFEKCIAVYKNPFKNESKQYLLIRHLFGSQEADWAIHYNGWTVDQFENYLNATGFKLLKVKRNSYKNTFNIEIFAVKIKDNSKIIIINNFKILMKLYLVDDSFSEKRLLSTWEKEMIKQLDINYAK